MFYYLTRGARSLISLHHHRQLLFQYQLDTFRSQLGRRVATAQAGPNVLRFRTKDTMPSKPPNILVYSDNAQLSNRLSTTLQDILKTDTYTVYPVTAAQVKAKAWPESTALLLIHGTVAKSLADVFVDFFLYGGKLLCIRSNLLGIIQQNDAAMPSGTPVAKCLKDSRNCSHPIEVSVIATESTQLNSPSILSACSLKSEGKALFTQILLQDFDESYASAASNEKPCLNKLGWDNLADLLSSQLGIETRRNASLEVPTFKNAYLLADQENKDNFLHTLNNKQNLPYILELGELTLEFCNKVDAHKPSLELLPVLIDDQPEDFSKFEYFSSLRTEIIGRVVLYSPVITSSMVIVSNGTLGHGFAAIPRRQTRGNGRNNNQWLSPEGCTMFSMQLFVPLSTPLGRRLPMIQHLVAVAVVTAVRKMQGYEEIDIRLKWPNDIYANGVTKIGGCIISSQLQGQQAVVNIGCGVNLSNSNPTMCINDLISEFNKRNNTNLQLLRYEHFLAFIFNEIERLFNKMQQKDLQLLYSLYYKYWLHEDKAVTLKNEDGSEVTGRIAGIDDYGYLLVKADDKRKAISVHPDGNSFDMMKGLIIPKYS